MQVVYVKPIEAHCGDYGEPFQVDGKQCFYVTINGQQQTLLQQHPGRNVGKLKEGWYAFKNDGFYRLEKE